MHVVIDQSRCKGHGQCAAVAPAVFELGDDDRGRVVAREVPREYADLVDDAILMCPEAAISRSGD